MTYVIMLGTYCTSTTMQFMYNKKCDSFFSYFVTLLIFWFLKKKKIFYSFKQSGIVWVYNIDLVLPGNRFHGILEI